MSETAEQTTDKGADEAVQTAATAGADAGAEAVAGQTAESASTEASGADAGSGLVRPEGLDDAFWDDKTGVKVADLVAALREKTEADAARLADVPQGDDTYDFALSEAVKVPEGFAVEIQADDPFLKLAADTLKAAGTPKGEFQKLLDGYAQLQIAAQEEVITDLTAQMDALGENKAARVAAVEAFVGANVKSADAALLTGAIKTMPALTPALEQLVALAKRSPQAAVTPTGDSINALDGLRGGALLDAVRRQAA